jgi:hypothetical protein
MEPGKYVSDDDLAVIARTAQEAARERANEKRIEFHVAPRVTAAMADELLRLRALVRDVKLDLEEAQDDLAEAHLRRGDAARVEDARESAVAAVVRARNRIVGVV